MMRMYQCYRCGESKDWYRFNPGQKYWTRKCIRCEQSPVGSMPIREDSSHVFHSRKIMMVCK